MKVSIPQELADELRDSGYARLTSKPRGGLLEFFIDGASQTAVWVTLLQTPSMFAFYAQWLKNHARSKGGQVTVRVSGPHGTHEILEIHGDDDVSTVVKRIRPLFEE